MVYVLRHWFEIPTTEASSITLVQHKFETRAKTDIRKRAKDKMIMEGNMNQKGDVLELKLFQKR